MDLETLNDCICTAKQNEERFLALIKATSDVIYSMSPDWQTMTRLYGRGFLKDTKEPDSDWLGKYIYPEDRDLISDVIQKSVAEKKTFELEHRVFQADGNVGWMFSRAVPIFDENGDIKGWFGAANDITEQKTAEIEKECLRKSVSDQLARIKALMDSLPVDVWISDIEGRLEMENRVISRVYGDNVKLGDRVDKHEEYKIFCPDTGKKISVEELPSVRAINGKTVMNMIVGYERFDGIGTEVVSSAPIYGENGDIIGSVAVSMDITELKRTEEALRESEERFRTVLENSMDGISLLNVKTRKYDYINPAMADITGFTLEDLEGFSLEERTARIHPADMSKNAQIVEASKKGEEIEAEFRWKIKNGEYRWLEIRFGPVPNESIEPIHIVIICRDITERKRAEQELEESKMHALNLVKELEEADKGKNRFISILSHELRNPLAVILGGVQMLDITQDIKHTTKAKKVIRRQTDKLCRLVDDLLELTRITQNKINLKKESINLNEIVKNTAEDVMLEYEKKGIKYETIIQTEPIFLNADPVRIVQAIENILFNALKFTQEYGTVWLTLKRENNYAVINIKDNGIGISPEILPHLFTPFTQADDTLYRNNGGLGLGLSIVKNIVDLHGGTVSAYSDGLGKGSVFTIRLPIVAEDRT